MEDFDVLGSLGEGTFGRVWKCQGRTSGLLVAVKEFLGGDHQLNITQEIVPLMWMRHDNLLKAFGGFVTNGRLYGLFELLDHSVMAELQARDRGLDPEVLRKYAFQILQGARFLHDRNIIHRDIKPDNLLVSVSGVVKLADLGFGRKVEATSVNLTQGLGTPIYMAPELILLDAKYGKPVDVWAIGCSIVIMAKRSLIFRKEDDHGLIHQIVATVGPLTQRQSHQYRVQWATEKIPVAQAFSKLTEKYGVADQQLADVIDNCLQMDPANRFTCSELLCQDYFTWDQFSNSFPTQLKLMVHRDDEERCRQVNVVSSVTSPPPDNATSHSDKKKGVREVLRRMTDAILCRDVTTVDVLVLSSQHQEMEIPEEAQDKPPQTGGSEEPAKEVKRKKGVKGVLQRMAVAIRRRFTSRVSPMSS